MYARKRFFHSVTQVSQSVPSETGIVRLVEATCKCWSCRHNESCPTGTFRLPWLRCFPCSSLPPVARRIPWYNTQWRGMGRTPSGTAVPLKCLPFATCLTLDMTNLDSNPRKPSSQSYTSPLRPIASWAMVLSLFKSRSSTPMGNSLG